MATAVSYSKTGTKEAAGVKLPAEVFELEASHPLLGQAYNSYLSNLRSAGASTKTRGLVRGGGKKPWRQKGTGRARVGSIRVPNWRGGGVVFGPTGLENYTQKLPVKMKRLAVKQALSLKAQQIIMLEHFDAESGRLKPTIQLLAKIGVSDSRRILLVVPTKTDKIDQATRNLPNLEVSAARYLTVFAILNADHIIFTKDALADVHEWLAPKESKVKA